MPNYKIEMLDYSFRPVMLIRDDRHPFIGQSNNNILTVHNGGYKELSFDLPYYIIPSGSTAQIINPVMDRLYNEAIICYTEFNSITHAIAMEEYFIVTAPNIVHNQSESTVSIKCLPYHVRILSALGVNTSIGGEDSTPMTVREWLIKILDGTGWTVGSTETLYETLPVEDDDGNLSEITQVKRRSITLENSNTYNMVQELCSMFECYAKFVMNVVDGSLQGKIDIVTSIGKDSGLTFEYSKNLMDISINYDSGDNIITKLYAFGGVNPSSDQLINITSINPTMEPYIFNFSYFKDLGLFTSADQSAIDGYMSKLKTLNKTMVSVTSKQTNFLIEKTDVSANVFASKQLADDLKNKIAEHQKKLKTLEEGTADYIALQETIEQEQADYNTQMGIYTKNKARLTVINSTINQYTAMQNSILATKNSIYTEINTKYGKFIREGMFQDEKYMYPEQLYADALEVSKRACYPVKSYVINVMMLDGVNGYAIEDLYAGDTVRVTDGTIGIENAMNIVKVINYNLDDRMSSTLELALISSKFDDLFSKIIRSSVIINDKINMLQKTLGAFNGSGVLTPEAMQSALASGNFLLKLNQSGSVFTTDEGLYIYDVDIINGKVTANMSQGLRLIGGGLYAKNSSEDEWTNIINTKGQINATYLQAGFIDTDKITIMNGDNPAFLWTKAGIWAYDTDVDGENVFQNYTKFYQDGLVIYQDNTLRMKLGKLFDGSYGMQLLNSAGNTTLRTDSDGELWLQSHIAVGGANPLASNSGISGDVSINPDNDVRFWAGATYSNRGAAPFRVTDDGKLYAFGGNIAGWSISTDNLKSGKVGLSASGSQPTDIRIFAGNVNKGAAPFRVTDDGSLFAQNAYISGVLFATTFKYDEFTVNAGSLFVIEADVLKEPCNVIQGTGATTIVCERNDLFQVGDKVRIKSGNSKPIDGEELYLADSWLQIESKLASGYEYTATWIHGSYGYTFPVKSPIINYGHNGSGHIILHTADGSDTKTYIDVVQPNYTSPWESVLPKARMGDLSGITDTEVQESALSGWGFYGNNVYIKGGIFGLKAKLDAKNGIFRLGNSDSDFKLKFDGINLLIGNGAITWANLDDTSRANLGAITLNVTGGTRCHIFNASAVNQTNATEFTVNVLQNGGAPVGATITYAWSAGGIFNNAITSNTNKYTPVVSAYSTNESFVQVIATVNGVAYTQRIPIAIGRTGADGATGSAGTNGATYRLNILGGTRSITYAADGNSHTPSTSAEFTRTLQKNGAYVVPTSISWTTAGHVSGSATTDAFTPTIAATWNGSVTTNHVILTVTYDGITFTEYAPIAVNKDATGLPWIDDWNSGVTVIKGQYIITPRLFAGTNSGTSNAPNITGVALGRDILAGNDNLIGIVGYKNNVPTFQLRQDGTFDFAGKMTFDGTTFNIDAGLIGSNNLIRNGRCDFGVDSWGTSSATRALSSSGVLGRQVFRVVATAANGSMTQTVTGLVVGNWYTISARVSKDTGATSARILTKMKNSANADVWSTRVTKTTNGWEIVKATFQAIEGPESPTAAVECTFYFNTVGEGYGSGWTDIKLEEGAQNTAWTPHASELKSTSVTINDSQFLVDTQNFGLTLRDGSNNVKLTIDATSGGWTVQGVGTDSVERQVVSIGGFMDCYYKVSGAWRHSTQYSSKGMYMYKSWVSGDPECFAINRWDGTSEDGVQMYIASNMTLMGIGTSSNKQMIQIRNAANASNEKLNMWENLHMHGKTIKDVGFLDMSGNIDMWYYDISHVGYLGIDADSSTALSINNFAGVNRNILFQSNGVSRWVIGVNADAESTGNAGSNFRIYRYNDDGSFIDSAMQILRSTGMTTVVSLYANGNVSAASFTDRTPFYEGDALSEIRRIKSDGSGNLDHNSLPEFVKVLREDAEEINFIQSVVESRVESAVSKTSSTNTLKSSSQNMVQNSVENEVTEPIVERDLGAMISMLTVAVQQLANEIDALKAQRT